MKVQRRRCCSRSWLHEEQDTFEKHGEMEWNLFGLIVCLLFQSVQAGLNFYLSQQESYRVLGEFYGFFYNFVVDYFFLVMFVDYCFSTFSPRFNWRIGLHSRWKY